MNEVSIVGAVIIGILAGWIAEQVMGREHGLLTNLIVGIVGAFLGAIAANMLVGCAGWAGHHFVRMLHDCSRDAAKAIDVGQPDYYHR